MSSLKKQAIEEEKGFKDQLVLFIKEYNEVPSSFMQDSFSKNLVLLKTDLYRSIKRRPPNEYSIEYVCQTMIPYL